MYWTIFPLVSSSNVRLVQCCATTEGKGGLRRKICPQKKAGYLYLQVHLLQALETPSYLNYPSSTLFGSSHRSEELLLLSQGAGFSKESYLGYSYCLGFFAHNNNSLDQCYFGKLRISLRLMMQALVTQTIILTLAVQGSFCDCY